MDYGLYINNKNIAMAKNIKYLYFFIYFFLILLSVLFSTDY